jgi:hypothetical protein
MLRKHVLHLLAPETENAGGAVTAPEADPTGLTGWMGGLPALEGAGDKSSPAQLRKEPDGTQDKGSGGSDDAAGAAATSGNDKSQPEVKPDAKAGEEAQAKAGNDKATLDAAAKAAEKKTDEEGEDKWPRSGSDWDKFKAKHAQREAKLQDEIKTRDVKLQEYETRLKEMEKTGKAAGEDSPEVKAKLEALTKERDELSEIVRRTEVTAHPKFQAHFNNLVQEQVQLLQGVLDNPDKVKELKELCALPESQYKREKIADAIEGIEDTYQREEARAFTRELRKIDVAKDKAIKGEVARAEQFKTQQTAKKTEEQNQTRAGFEKIWGEMRKAVQDPKEGNPMYQLRDGDEAWNKGVAERLEATKRLLAGGEGVKPQDIVKAALDAVAMPTLLKAYQSYMTEKEKEITSLRDQLKKLSAVQPKTGGAQPDAGGQDGGGNRGGAPKIGSNPMEAASGWVKGLPSLS